ncbi:MAG: Gfo/Idh/MocA family oxidoreductase [Planctomycetota bacterium]|nr:MAG: Gfo/Idh/MocA family oxidoreductase [Planctomycetota bacterium]
MLEEERKLVVSEKRKQMNRREFIAGAGATAISFAAIKAKLVYGTAANSKVRLGMIGCGMRGKDIGDKFIEHGGYKIVAAADYFEDRVDEFGEKFGIEQSKRFTGLSCYKKVLESGVDAVAIESPPYFHPEQAAAAISAGVHVYLAKPIGVDVPGCVSVSETGRRATANKLCFIVDFQTRADALYREAIKRVHYGDIGRIMYGDANFVTGPTWLTWNPIGKYLEEKPNDPEVRLRAWGLDKALSGDIISEQAIHAIDVASWILGEDAVSAYGTGGLASRKFGNVWDYFAVVYDFPKDIVLSFNCKQGGTDDYGGILCRFYGTDGVIDTHYGGEVSIRGNTPYKGGKTSEIYWGGASKNIADFYDNIINGRYANTTVQPSVRSVLTSILGRSAAYAHSEMTWDEMMKANEKLEADFLRDLKA